VRWLSPCTKVKDGTEIEGAKVRTYMLQATLNTCQAYGPLLTDSFEPFHPKVYLREYYSQLGDENRALLHFLTEAYAHIFTEIDTANILEFGGGPTIYQLISAAKYPASIDFSDYLGENLNEVRTWLGDRPEKFPWDEFVRYVLKHEGECSDRCAIEQRMQLIRNKVQRLIYCDAKKTDPLGDWCRSPYDIVSVNFVLESITTEMTEWDLLVDNVVPLVRPQGYLLMCAIVGATYYRVGEHFFPAVPITPEIMERKLTQQHFSIVHIHTIRAEHKDEQGYDGICMVLAKKGKT
jgi:hypothetical protein